MNYNCLFCDFIKDKSREKQFLYEDEKSYVMLDDFPISKGHSLVILKNHVADISSVKSEDAEELGRITALIAGALQDAFTPKKIYVVSLCEEVKHFHYHLIPRYEEDKKGFVHFMGPRKKLENYEEMIRNIKGCLKDRLTKG